MLKCPNCDRIFTRSSSTYKHIKRNVCKNGVPSNLGRPTNHHIDMELYVGASQDWTCKLCNEMLSAFFKIYHIIPMNKGGSNDISNFRALCQNCHELDNHIG